MKFNFIYIFILGFFFLFSCTQNIQNKNIETKDEHIYENYGFVLMYDKILKDGKILRKNIDNDKYHVIHHFLKKKVNLLLTCYGTIAHEYAYFGIPVINASINNPHINYNFCFWIEISFCSNYTKWIG